MTQSIMSIRIEESGVLALPVELGQRYKLKDGDTLKLIPLSDGTFFLVPVSEKPVTFAELRSTFGKAMRETGYDTSEKVVELVREVKREIAEERDARGKDGG